MSLQVEHIVKKYGAKTVLNDVSFSAQAGEVVGFLGPNGAGKSTLMKICMGYVRADAGCVKVCGREVAEQDFATKSLLGYLPEHNPLYLGMYVREYLCYVSQFYAIRNRKERISELIERTGLAAECHKRIGQLSKGYRQRVGLAAALVHEPRVLILDEPTTGLDPNQLIEIRQLIADFGRDRTVLFSTHIMQEAAALCNRVVMIHHGTIVANDTIANLTQEQPLETLFHQLTTTKI